MVWPERRLKLLAATAAAGLEGFQALLRVLGLEYTVEWEDANGQQVVHNQGEGFQALEESIITDIIVWSGIPQLEPMRSEAQKRGITVMSPAEFLQRLWQVEQILPVFPPFTGIGDKPLLWVILYEAGFAPSLLWYEDKLGWQGIQGEGTAWVVPGDWLVQVSQGTPLGRSLKQKELSWVIRTQSIDFYETGEPLKFRGSMPRWPEPLSEQGACQAVAQALGLGISWMDIRKTLGQEQSKQGWLTDDFGWTQGPDREELPAAEINDVEDRRAG